MVDFIGPKAKVNYRVAIANINILSALNTYGEIHLDRCSIYTHKCMYIYVCVNSVCLYLLLIQFAMRMDADGRVPSSKINPMTDIRQYTLF
jgi:hypothetical protein